MGKTVGGAEIEEERRLVQAAQSDRRRFDEIYERYFNRIYAFALTRTADQSEAEDVTSETFRRAVLGLPAFEWREVPLSAWLFRIAANATADVLRKKGRAVDLEAVGDIADQGAVGSRFEERAALFDLVERLPMSQRRVVWSRFVADRSVRETAACLGKSEGAIKQLQLRALRQLRAWMVVSDG